MPEFQGWLKKSPINMDKAFCGLCQSELRAHFTDLRTSRPLMEENDTTENFWIKVHNWKVGDEYKFRFLSDGVIKMMCLPLSNAEVERTFSATSHVKWWRRAQMKKDLLESSMHCIFGLKWMDKSLKDWIPPRELLHYDKKHLYD